MGIVDSIKRMMHLGGEKGVAQAVPTGSQLPPVEGPLPSHIGDGKEFLPDGMKMAGKPVNESVVPQPAANPENVIPIRPSVAEAPQVPQTPSGEQKG